MAACEWYIIQLGEEREREREQWGSAKSILLYCRGHFLSGFRKINYLFVGGVWGEGDWTLLASSLVCGAMLRQHTLKKLGFHFQGFYFHLLPHLNLVFFEVSGFVQVIIFLLYIYILWTLFLKWFVILFIIRYVMWGLGLGEPEPFKKIMFFCFLSYCF